MPEYLFDGAVWSTVWPLVAFAAVMATGLTAPLLRQSNRIVDIWLSIFSLALLGALTGQITGNSREPAVSAVLPAVLGLVGGVTLYILGVKVAAYQGFVSAALAAFSLCLLVGISWGTQIRLKSDEFNKDYESRAYWDGVEYRLQLKKLEYEKALQDTRAMMGLPAAVDSKERIPAAAPLSGGRPVPSGGTK